MTDLRAILDAARASAINGGLPVRRSDGKLYALLAQIMAACELVILDGREDELRGLMRNSIDQSNPDLIGKGRANSNNGKGRRYAELGSDAFILVCRYVLADKESTAARSRYSSALREAYARQISSADLADWLIKNGGVNTLFRARRVGTQEVAIKTLHLNQPVTCPKIGEFTLTLRMDHRGFFDVIAARAAPDREKTND